LSTRREPRLGGYEFATNAWVAAILEGRGDVNVFDPNHDAAGERYRSPASAVGSMRGQPGFAALRGRPRAGEFSLSIHWPSLGERSGGMGTGGIGHFVFP
jgi:hypothetical protein